VVTGIPTIELAYVADAGDPETLARLAAHPEIAGLAVLLIVTTPASQLVTPAALAALPPHVRPILLAAEPLAPTVIDALAARDGAMLELTGTPVTTPRTEVA